MFKLTEQIIFLKFIGIIKFVKIREFQEFLKFGNYFFDNFSCAHSLLYLAAVCTRCATCEAAEQIVC